MDKIAGFQINYDILTPGIYLSRIGGDIIACDVRLRKPNVSSFLLNPATYTMGHLLVTMAHNSTFHGRTIYFNPIGCRTGFYFLVRNMRHSDVIVLIKDIFVRITDYSGGVPGYTPIECGNYLEHDLEEAKQEAVALLSVALDWMGQRLTYPV